jgi:hypothetical protein
MEVSEIRVGACCLGSEIEGVSPLFFTILDGRAWNCVLAHFIIVLFARWGSFSSCGS